jgi:hypothetical protein
VAALLQLVRNQPQPFRALLLQLITRTVNIVFGTNSLGRVSVQEDQRSLLVGFLEMRSAGAVMTVAVNACAKSDA